MKNLYFILFALLFVSCQNYRESEETTTSEGSIAKITYPRETTESSSTNNLPACQSRGQSCGFSYSSSYENSNKPYGQALKCRIEYWRPGENSAQAASYSRIFYTNCGSCSDAANKANNDGFTSSESPTSYLIYQADGESLRCDTQELQLNTEYTTGWSFRVTTLEGSTCHESAFYSYASRDTGSEDTCID